MARSVPTMRTMVRPTNQSVMTPARLAQIGEALFGQQWQRPLARALGCSDRQVRYLAAGERAVTVEIADQIAQIIKVRGDALARLGRQLEGAHSK